MIIIHLSRLLGEQRMTQKELAGRTGVRPNTINEIYHGIIDRVSLETLDRICEVLDCEFNELIERIPNSSKRTGKDLILEEHKRRRK